MDVLRLLFLMLKQSGKVTGKKRAQMKHLKLWLGLGIVILLLASAPLSAEEQKSHLDLGKDRFLAGSQTVQDIAGIDDLFLFGETVLSKQDITGSLHGFGRKIISAGTVAGDAYIAGVNVSLDEKVTGDVTVSGYNIQVGDIGGNLRAFGSSLTISGTVSGYALVAGESIKLESIIKGDVSMAAKNIDFSEGARIDGTLILYAEQDDQVMIPAQVISEDRIERRSISSWPKAGSEEEASDWRNDLIDFFKGVLTITIIATLMVAIAPQKLTDMRQNIIAQPFRNLCFGFLALSTVLGSTIMLMITGIGFLLVPVTLLIGILSIFAGYALGAHTLGVALLLSINQPEPERIGAKAFAAGVGALAAAVIALTPFVGWLFILAVTFVGAGAMSVWLFQKPFFALARN